jgi:hypothetical protein
MCIDEISSFDTMAAFNFGYAEAVQSDTEELKLLDKRVQNSATFAKNTTGCFERLFLDRPRKIEPMSGSIKAVAERDKDGEESGELQVDINVNKNVSVSGGGKVDSDGNVSGKVGLEIKFGDK